MKPRASQRVLLLLMAQLASSARDRSDVIESKSSSYMCCQVVGRALLQEQCHNDVRGDEQERVLTNETMRMGLRYQ